MNTSPSSAQPRWLSDAEADLAARAQAATTTLERARLWLNVSELRALLGDRDGAREAAERAHEQAETQLAGMQAATLARMTGDMERATELCGELRRGAATEDAGAHFAAWAAEFNPVAKLPEDITTKDCTRDIRLALRRSLDALAGGSVPTTDGHPELADALASLRWLDDGTDALAELLADLRDGLDGDSAPTRQRLDELAEHADFRVSASWLALTLALRADGADSAKRETAQAGDAGLREVLERAQARVDGSDAPYAAILAASASLALRAPGGAQQTPEAPDVLALNALSATESPADALAALVRDETAVPDADSDPGAAVLEAALDLVQIACGPVADAAATPDAPDAVATPDAPKHLTEAWLLRCASGHDTDSTAPWTSLLSAASQLEQDSPETSAALRLEAAIRTHDRKAVVSALQSLTNDQRASDRLVLGLAKELAGDATPAATDYVAAADGGFWTLTALTEARREDSTERWRAAADAASGPMERALRLFDAARALDATDADEDKSAETRNSLLLEALLLAPDLSPAVELGDVLAGRDAKQTPGRLRWMQARRTTADGNEEIVARTREALCVAATGQRTGQGTGAEWVADDAHLTELASLLDPLARRGEVVADVRAQMRADVGEEHTLIAESPGASAELRAAEERALGGDKTALEEVRAGLRTTKECSVAWALAALVYFDLEPGTTRSVGEANLDMLAETLDSHPTERAPAWALRALANREEDSTAGVTANAELGRRCQRALDAAALVGKAGSMAARLGDESLALELLRTALKRVPSWPTFLDLYARLTADAHRPSHAAMAAETFADTVAHKEHQSAALIAAARYWTEGGRQDRAVAALEKALKVDPSQDGLFEELCGRYEAAGAHRKLAALIRRRLGLLPADAPTDTLHLALGRALLQAGDRAHAKRAVAGLLKEQPENVDALEVLAEACMRDNDSRRAEAIWSRLAELLPSGHRQSALLGLSELARRAGDSARAMITLRQLLDEQPDCLEASTRLSALQDAPPKADPEDANPDDASSGNKDSNPHNEPQSSGGSEVNDAQEVPDVAPPADVDD